jgi:hypothetical protein
MALAFIIIGVLVGATLGMRFKVPVLAVAVPSAVMGAAFVGVMRADQFWSVVVEMVLFGTAVQFGYLAGIVARARMASIRTPRREAVAMQKVDATWRPEKSACVVSGDSSHTPRVPV